MIKFNSLEKTIASKLMKNREFDIYQDDFLLSFNPIDLVESLKKLCKIEILDFDGRTVKLSKDGYVNLIRYRFEIFNRAQPWRK